MPGEDAVELVVGEGKLERRPGRTWRAAPAAARPRASARSGRAVTSPRRWRVRKPVPHATSSVRLGGSAATARSSSARVLVPDLPLARREAAETEVPVVVLGRARGRSTPSRLLEYGACGRSNPSRTSPRAATARRSTRSAQRSGRTRLLDVHADEDHNRSVFTLVGDEGELGEALVAGVRVAKERIDLRRHEGAHPRIGAADVVPIVRSGRGRARAGEPAARVVSERIAAELALPVFHYGALAPSRGPAFFRRGGPEALQRRLDAGELEPTRGRGNSTSVPAASWSARVPADRVQRQPLRRRRRGRTRDRSDRPRERRRLPGVRALGLDLPRAGVTQVSMNVEEWEATALHEIVARVSRGPRRGPRSRMPSWSADAGGAAAAAPRARCCGSAASTRRGARGASARRVIWQPLGTLLLPLSNVQRYDRSGEEVRGTVGDRPRRTCPVPPPPPAENRMRGVAAITARAAAGAGLAVDARNGGVDRRRSPRRGRLAGRGPGRDAELTDDARAKMRAARAVVETATHGATSTPTA